VEGRLVVKDCSLVAPDGRVRNHVAVVVVGSLIVEVSANDLVPTLPGDWVVNAGGRLLCPGISDCHSNYLGSFAALSQKPLTSNEIEVLTAFSLARAQLQGITFSVEQLANAVNPESGISAQAKIAKEMGARLILSYASSDVRSVECNLNLATALASDSLVRIAIGLKSSTLSSDELLRVAGRGIDKYQLTSHLGLAQQDTDLAQSVAINWRSVVNRYDAFGLLVGGSVCYASELLVKSELKRLIDSRVLLALTPLADLLCDANATLVSEQMLSSGSLLGLGSGGVGTLLESASLANARLSNLVRVARALDAHSNLFRMAYEGPSELKTMLWGIPSGSISVGAVADFVLYDDVYCENDYVSLVDILRARVLWTVVNGCVVVREGELLAVSWSSVVREAKKVLAARRYG
jgi:5-methylthioadenosine/S-adenosylhomocysteine deaminase